jgi:hypothetical protein
MRRATERFVALLSDLAGLATVSKSCRSMSKRPPSGSPPSPIRIPAWRPARSLLSPPSTDAKA